MRFRREMACCVSILDCGEAGGTSANYCNATDLLRYRHPRTEEYTLYNRLWCFFLQQPNPESNNGGDSVSDMPINGGWPEMRGPRWTTIAREMR